MFTFDELCGRPVAAADYIALAGRFHTVAVEGVPEFSGATRTQARAVSSRCCQRFLLFACLPGTWLQPVCVPSLGAWHHA